MIDQRVERVLRSLGLSGVYQGYSCLTYAVLLIREDPRRLELVTKRLYPDLARLCGVSVGSVDSAIRTAIGVCCRRCGPKVARMCGVQRRPTVAQFIDGLVRAVAQEDEGGSL